jgi:hypothetical protein
MFENSQRRRRIGWFVTLQGEANTPFSDNLFRLYFYIFMTNLYISIRRRHDTRHNDTLTIDIQLNKKYDTQHNDTQHFDSFVMLGLLYGAMVFPRVCVDRVKFVSVILSSRLIINVWFLTLKFDRVL